MLLVLGLAGAYVVICILGFFLHRHYMYFPVPERVSPADVGLAGIEEQEIESGDGTKLVAWYGSPRPGKPTILYFHGNAGNAAARVDKIEIIRGDGNGVFYLNNRGYGGSEGAPSEAFNVADALAAYDHLIDIGVSPDEIVLYGESLGSGQAVRLAGLRRVKAVVLEAPLTTTVDIGRQIYWFLPLTIIMKDQYRNIDNIADVTAPLLLLHGQQDEIIPHAHSKRIYEAARGFKRLETFPSAAHSNLFDHGAWDKVRAFLDDLPDA